MVLNLKRMTKSKLERIKNELIEIVHSSSRVEDEKAILVEFINQADANAVRSFQKVLNKHPETPVKFV